MSAPEPLPSARRYCFSEYRNWPQSERWEIIDGVAYAMAPAPSTRHQRVVLRFAAGLEGRLVGKSCTPFTAPTDVKLSEYDVVQPDVLVVCDPAKITPTHIEGAPDLIVEVLSPATAPRDLHEKFQLYERYGVREYLTVNPVENYLHRFRRGEDGCFGPAELFTGACRLAFTSLDGVELPLWDIFELPEPEVPTAGPIQPGKGPEAWR